MPHAEDRFVTGTLGQSGDDVRISSAGTSSLIAHLTATFSGTITWEARNTTANTWSPIRARQVDTGATGLTSVLAGAPNNVAFQLPIGGWREVRARCSAYTSGTLTVDFCASNGASDAALVAAASGSAVSIADGADTALGTTSDTGIITNIAGTVIGFLRGNIIQWAAFLARFPAALVGGRLDVNIGATAVTQPVSGTLGATQSGTWTVQPGNTANTTAWKVDGSAVTQPVSGTVTANQGTQNAAGAASWPVQGATAAGAAVTGNPVLMGGSDGANAQALKTDTSGRPLVSGAVATGTANASAGNPVFIATQGTTAIQSPTTLATGSDGIGSINGLNTMANAFAWNGASFDRQRNNIDVTLLASAGRTTTQTSADLVTYNLGALKVILDMTVVGTGSVTVTINEKDPASGKYILLLSGGAVTTNVTNEYTVDPMVPAVANVTAQKRCPRTLQIVVTANNANTATYSVGLMELPA